MKKRIRLFLNCVALAVLAAPVAAGGLRAGQGARSLGPSGLGIVEEWRFSTFGRGIGLAGLHVVDLDGDGDREIVTAAAPDGYMIRFWYVASRRPDGTYVQDWSSDEFPEDITSLRVAQVDADPALEVIIGTVGQVLVYDGATRQLQTSWTSDAEKVIGLAIADVDGDGALEAVFCDDALGTDTLYVHALATGVEEYAGRGYGCHDLAVGNVDLDPGLEIVVAPTVGSSGPVTGYMLDGATRAVEWANPAGFGRIVRLADLDGDGRSEVAAGEFDIHIYDAELHALAATLPVEHRVDALELVDVEGDGPLEVVYGDDQSGSIHVHNGQTLALKWEVDNPDSGVGDIAIGQLDGDAAREVVWGAGHNSSGPDHLYVLDSATRALEWTSLDFNGRFVAMSHGDVDADGRPEILYGSDEVEWLYTGPWFVRDASTKELEYQSPIREAFGGFLNRIANADVDGDPQQEIFAVRGDEVTGGSYLGCYDGLTHAEQWTVEADGYYGIVAMATGDVSGDATPELVAVLDSPGVLTVMNASDGSPLWQLPLTGGGGAFLRLGNVDADASVEIVFVDASGALFAVDGATHAVSPLGSLPITGLDVADRDGDGIDDIVVGTDDGRLLRISPDGTASAPIVTYPDAVHALRIADVTGDGVGDYVLTTAESLRIRDGAANVEIWDSGPLRNALFTSAVGHPDSLIVADLDADGRIEIMVGLGMLGIRIFEIPPPVDLALSVTDTPDPALVTSNVTYTWTIANTSTLPAAGVGLVVALPVNATLVSSPAACTLSSGGLTCSLGPLAAESSTNVVIVVTPTGPGTLATHAWAGASEPDPDVENNNASATTTVTATVQADLAAAIDDGRVLVGTGQALTYAVSVANLGPWPVTSVRLVNPLPAALENPVYTPAVGSYDPGSGVWSGLDLLSGGSAALTLTATVAAAATGTIANPLSVVPPAGVDDLVAGNNSAVDVDVVAVDRTELQHGTMRTAVLDGAGDRYFAISQRPYSSYEVVVDQVSGDVGELASPLRLERLSPGLNVLTSASATGVGFSRSLRWLNTAASTVDGEAVRVRSGSCTADCGPDDAFRIRAYDTTYDLARFNNTSGQGTVVVLQNNGGAPASGRLYFWSGSGALLTSLPFAALAPHGVLTVNTAALAGTAGLAGSITVANDAPYGTLAGKAVAVDPASGASFDTLLRPRPR